MLLPGARVRDIGEPTTVTSVGLKILNNLVLFPEPSVLAKKKFLAVLVPEEDQQCL